MNSKVVGARSSRAVGVVCALVAFHVVLASGCVVETHAPKGSASTGGAGGASSVGGAGGASSTADATASASQGATGTSSTSKASSTASSTGSAMPTCDGLAADIEPACGACIESSCCAELDACDATPGCMACALGESGCVQSAKVDALLECAFSDCVTPCSCMGPASTSGTVAGVTPQPDLGKVLPDPSGKVKVVLQHTAQFVSGDAVIVVYFTPDVAQSTYPPNGSVGCAVFKVSGSGALQVVDTTQLCEVNLSALKFASQPGVCDGKLEGGFAGVFGSNQTLSGTFSLPMNIAASQVSQTCKPFDTPCTTNAQCCSQSCSVALGICN